MFRPALALSPALARLGDASRSIIGIEQLLIALVATATPKWVIQLQGIILKKRFSFSRACLQCPRLLR